MGRWLAPTYHAWLVRACHSFWRINSWLVKYWFCDDWLFVFCVLVNTRVSFLFLTPFFSFAIVCMTLTIFGLSSLFDINWHVLVLSSSYFQTSFRSISRLASTHRCAHIFFNRCHWTHSESILVLVRNQVVFFGLSLKTTTIYGTVGTFTSFDPWMLLFLISFRHIYISISMNILFYLNYISKRLQLFQIACIVGDLN